MEFKDLTPQQQWIVEFHRDKQYHCSTEYPMIDFRKRISELNAEYMKERGFEIVGIPCTKHNHKGNIHMRRAEKKGVVLSNVALPTKAPSLNELSPADARYWNSLQTA